jgi:two-component system nitrate/nitrite response regulator NarL
VPPVRLESAARSVRVLVADGSPATRAALRAGLDGRCRVCAEAADAAKLVEVALRERPDVCLVGADLPGRSLPAVGEIARTLPETAIVVLGDPPTASDLFAALDAGAIGYLPSDTHPKRLSRAVRRVAEGEAAFPRALVIRLVEELRVRGRLRHAPAFRELTNREVEVLELLGHGLSTGDITKRLYVAPVTVRTHIASAVRKLGLHDREGALRLLRSR